MCCNRLSICLCAHQVSITYRLASQGCKRQLCQLYLVSSTPSTGALLEHTTQDIIRILVRNLNTELLSPYQPPIRPIQQAATHFLNSHHHLHSVQTIQPKIIREMRRSGKLCSISPYTLLHPPAQSLFIIHTFAGSAIYDQSVSLHTITRPETDIPYQSSSKYQ